VEDGGGSVGELEGEVGLEGKWGDVVGSILAMVVGKVGVHGWAGVDESFWVYAWCGRTEQSMGVSRERYGRWRTRWTCCTVAD
jgi:hypothetical protein